MEIESRRVVSRGSGEERVESHCFMGIQFQVYSGYRLQSPPALLSELHYLLWNTFVLQTLKGLLGPSRLGPEAKEAVPGRELWPFSLICP